jgi:leucyl-tRNA synthetase
LNDEGIAAFKNWRPEFGDVSFIKSKDGKFYTVSEVGKMSKSKYNAVNPDDVVEKYGADCFRMYEMFLGPIEQSKPWNTKGIEGVSKFLRKFWSLFFDANGNFAVAAAEPTKAELKILHTAIKKVTDDIERFSLNTCVSAFMVCVNELKAEKCNKRSILQDLTVLIAPFAPHLAEELWHQLGNSSSVVLAEYPMVSEAFLQTDTFTYPIAINGKTRLTMDLPADASKEALEKMALDNEKLQKYLDGKAIKKIIVVPKRMINLVVV